ncbi:hypothetical protein [uncultured Enterovirga sp.]|uniref:hypothetical protein n=1 Tax=uncultured Enterovirga sp. TaxID=2026352 RepID=UPI0035CBDC25
MNSHLLAFAAAAAVALTGSVVKAQPLAPPRYQTPAANDNSDRAATTAFVRATLGGGLPFATDPLKVAPGQMFVGPSGANPFAGPYPAHLSGIGGTGFYDAGYLGQNGMFMPNGTMTVGLPHPYGNMTTGSTGMFAVGSSRSGCVSGYTDPSQVAGYYENGAAAICSSADSQPLMGMAVGTFTATTFTPSAPIVQTSSLFIKKGMWLRTADDPPINGQVTAVTVNGSGGVTQITVAGWYQINAGGYRQVGGVTPASGRIYINPQDKQWVNLPALFLNSFSTTGNVTSGSATITGVASTNGIMPNGQLLFTGAAYATSLFPAGTYVKDIDPVANTITASKNATGSATGVAVAMTAGTQMNHGVVAELDIFNKVPFLPTITKGTLTTTADSYTITGVTNAADLRPYMYLFAPGIPGGLAAITSIDVATGAVRINSKASSSGTAAYTATYSVEEGGTAVDCAGIDQDGNSCYLQRGNVAFGFKSAGAREAAFLLRPNGFAPIPKWGFAVDHQVNPAATSVADFAVLGTDGLPLWKVDSFGNSTGASFASLADYKVGSTTVLDNTPWSAFTPAVANTGGALTGIASASIRTKRVGTVMHVQGMVTITTNGPTTAGPLTISVPPAAYPAIRATVHGHMSGGLALTGFIAGGGAFVTLTKYDGTYPGGDGMTIDFAAAWEVAP